MENHKTPIEIAIEIAKSTSVNITDQSGNKWVALDLDDFLCQLESIRDNEEMNSRRNLYVNGIHDGQSLQTCVTDSEAVDLFNEKYTNDTNG